MRTNSLSRSWSAAWERPAFRKGVAALAIVGVPVLYAIPHFFGWSGARTGMLPPDPVLDHLGPYDLTWPIFTVLYGTVLLVVGRTLPDPWLILRGAQAYVLILLLRMCTMFLLPLEAPVDIIPLVDPITAVFYPGGEPFLKDLFFSGHTATMVLMTLLARGRLLRLWCLLATVLVGAGVVAQHVHWTVDVLAAPVFAGIAWWASAFSLRAFGRPGV